MHILEDADMPSLTGLLKECPFRAALRGFGTCFPLLPSLSDYLRPSAVFKLSRERIREPGGEGNVILQTSFPKELRKFGVCGASPFPNYVPKYSGAPL